MATDSEFCSETYVASIMQVITDQCNILNVCYCVLQGDILALLGPTLLDIARHVSGSDNSIPVIFSVRSVGYLAGSITGGVLYDRYRTKRYAKLSASVVIAVLCK